MLAPLAPYVTVGAGLLVLHNAWVALLGYHAVMVAVLFLSGTRITVRGSLRGRGFLIPLVAALGGACGGLLLYILWHALSVTDDFTAYLPGIGLNEQTLPVFLAYFVLVNPLIEEYYWRGYLASGSRSIELNDLMFSGYHLLVVAGQMSAAWLPVVFLGLTAGAWVWRQMNRFNGGLLASAVSHMTADITVMLTIYFMSVR